MSGAAAVLLLAVTGCYTPAALQHDEARNYLAPSELPRSSPRARPLHVQRIRLLADEDYRRSSGGWENRARDIVRRTSDLLEAQFGVRLEVVEVGPWSRSGPAGKLEPLLQALHAADDGSGVDLVMGFTGATTLVTASIHELGCAELLGRHMVFRAMDDTQEASTLEESLSQLSVQERTELNLRRTAHKEVVVLAHEWGHTQGARHVSDPTDVMSPLYAVHQDHFGRPNLSIVALSLASEARFHDPAVATRFHTELSRLLASLGPSDDPSEDLALAGTAGETQSVHTRLPQGDVERLNAALRQLPREPSRAWAVIAAVRARAPDDPGVAHLACSAAVDPRVQRPEAEEICTEAARLAPTDPLARLALARMYLEGGKLPPALENLALARTRLDGGTQPASLWLELAQLDVRAGALTRAEEALSHAGPSEQAEDLAKAVAERRSQLGIPRDAGRFNIPPDREPAFVELVMQADEVLRKGQTAAVRAMVEQALFRYPDAPALLALICDVQLRSGQKRDAARTCARALSGDDDFAVAHVLAARAASTRAESERHLRRAIAISPEWPQPWEDLEGLYRRSGDRHALQALQQERRSRAGAHPR